jgi:hypothetical protein
MPIPPSTMRRSSPSRERHDFASLARPEQLVVWSVRAIALGHADCPGLSRMFGLSLGHGAEDALLGFMVVVRTLGWCGRRRLRLHAPGCMHVSDDEHELLALFAAAQASLVNGDEDDLRNRLAALAEPGAHEALTLSLQAAAGALEVGGYRLDAARRKPPRPAETTAARTLH